jgi:DNA repair protein RadC
MLPQVKKSCQCQLRDKKHQYFSIFSLPTDSVIVDHAVFFKHTLKATFFLMRLWIKGALTAHLWN